MNCASVSECNRLRRVHSHGVGESVEGYAKAGTPLLLIRLRGSVE
jgi:hypothetical protein